ncbi:16948_t:CDS:2 [Funneliformis geosporum]|uniref:16948_t:CDS:1 n=1 Tax=Funneliformis geosporum TaxID=1117311 RepID=A0A9W4SCT9_9GLOM|nr:16948_t:CDS:2 [Funneliformis geosporum]
MEVVVLDLVIFFRGGSDVGLSIELGIRFLGNDDGDGSRFDGTTPVLSSDALLLL